MKVLGNNRSVRRTEKKLRDSLVILGKNKNINHITVTELCECADINRDTFYLHYTDIASMIVCFKQDLLEQFSSLLDAYSSHDFYTNPKPLFLDMCSFIEAHADLMNTLLSANGDPDFARQLCSSIHDKCLTDWTYSSYTDTVTFEYRFSFVVFGVIGLLQTWLENDRALSTEQIANLICKLVVDSLK